MLEELTKKNGKGVWLREIEKILKRFDASLELFLDRVELYEEEMDKIRQNEEMEKHVKSEVLRTQRMKSITGVLEEVEVLIDTHFFNVFSGTKSSTFLKRVVDNQNAIETKLFKKRWKTLNCSPKTMKMIREIQENLLCVGKRKELITKQTTNTKCYCSKAGLALNAKHIVSNCKKVSGEINARHDIIVNILLNKSSSREN